VSIEVSFSNLALYAACPLKYRYLRVEHLDEPATPPDWRNAPVGAPATVASEPDLQLGVAVHAALMRWQRAVDGGAPASAEALLRAVREQALRRGLSSEHADHGIERLSAGLTAYASGPWPRRSTLFLEQPVRHRVVDSAGFALDLRLRVDRVVRYRRQVAILDFKTVPPHAFELRVDEWQLRTYAMAAPELLGVAAGAVRLFILDLRNDREISVDASAGTLAAARDQLLACAQGIAGSHFGVERHPDRPCWACGFRLACPSSLAPK
jgi:hypothetical protein